MKKFFAISAIAVMFAACAKEEPKAPVDEFSAPVEETGLVPVEFTSNVTASVLTKAQGGVDEWNGKQTLHVYGYQRTQNMDYTTPFIDNVSATSPASGTGPSGITVVNAESKPYYYVSNYTYDFYGYYVDGLSVTPLKKTDGVYVSLELTGGEDIMVAKADPHTDVLRAQSNGTFTGGTSWNDKYAYSAYAARRGVQPSLIFQHQLVRFTFEIVSGSEFETLGDPVKNLFVTGLYLQANNKTDLCVAGPNLGLTNIDRENMAVFTLKERDAQGNLGALTKYEVPSMSTPVVEGSNVIGESIMVIPNVAPAQGKVDTYKMSLMMTQHGYEIPYDVDLKFSDVEGAPQGQTQFTAGYSYRISIKVYSLAEIEISAKLEEWKNGGQIAVDTDYAPEII